MFRRNAIKALLLFYAAITIAVFFSSGKSWALTTQVTPQNIPITLFYHGAQISIQGQNAADAELIVKISSDPTDAHMKFKGKAAGLFWMKMGDISFEHVPAAYLLYTSRNLDTILPEGQRIKEGIGFESIMAGTSVESSAEGMDPDRWIDEFIKFKKAEKLYQIREGSITRNNDAYQLDIDWPYQAAPGTYNIEVIAVRDGSIINRAETNLTVARTGIVAKLSNLAFNHAAVYGILAIFVAMAAGFAVGALFKKGGGAH